ncbi:DHA1 family bicyclomycin/chloramphenicol resistance-like MFS transporter [Pseudochelatococcus lubricantis]|uniref:Bcr/CflA family efflux transporter n=1 Tax=Pseudochelatococcus lubricantis TaxID=1538102 RepID=A0ABX0V033_9HYPH|nr:multidrug effflux MFS transporter [Pseudochelatococcus lubricantis]NIJ58546.1 DHA1 family bicyclomycin/chloramphenicol resistance-like MFS transporter [Pseudochelatococcus lubricantis]
MTSTAPVSDRVVRYPPFGEFVALIALMMSLVALSIDNLLPAFVPIQHEFQLASANDAQFIISSYMIGFAVSQLVYGPLSDSIGRRPSMLIGLAIYLVGTLMALTAGSFTTLLIARVVQGVGAAASRVLVMTIVRDRYHGQEMARVMSFVMMVFIIGPVIAPGSGALMLLLGSWRMIFVSMLALGVGLLTWFSLRMPETLNPHNRMKASPRAVLEGARQCITNRVALGYTLAISLMLGTLMGYINSAQQVFETDVFKLGPWFPLVFGLIAAVMGVAAFTNAQLVQRVGPRRLSHICTVAFVLTSLALVLLTVAYGGFPPLVPFSMLLAALHFIFSLSVPNFNALAMEPMGRIAGTASSFIGAVTTALSTVIGLLVGQAYDGTVLPLALGYLVFSALALAVVYWTERGRMFRRDGAA